MENVMSGTLEQFESVPPNPEAVKLINRVMDQNDRILAMNADLLKVASCYSMMIVGTKIMESSD